MKYKWKDVIASYTPEKRKNTSIWARVFSRPLSFVLTYVLVNLGVTANMVSVFSIFEAILACVFIVLGGKYTGFGILLFLLWDVLDCTDGNIARVKKSASVIGEYMDAVSGYTAPAFIFLSVGVAAFNTTMFFPDKKYYFIVMGAVASISDILSRIIYQKYTVTEYKIRGKKDSGIEEKRKVGILLVVDKIMRTLTYSCLFMPLLVFAYFTNHFDILIFSYTLYCLAVLIASYVYFIKKAYDLKEK